MMFLRFMILGLMLGILLFLALGPGRKRLGENLSSLPKVGEEIQLKTQDQPEILGAQREGASLPPVLPAILRPIQQASTNIEKTIKQIKKLPEEELNTIKSQICNPQ